MSELEALKAEHGKYPTTNKPGVPGKELYAKRVRLPKKQDLTTAQREALKNTQARQKLDTYDDVMQAVLQLGRFPLYHRGRKNSGHEHNLRRKIENKCKDEVLFPN